MTEFEDRIEKEWLKTKVRLQNEHGAFTENQLEMLYNAYRFGVATCCVASQSARPNDLMQYALKEAGNVIN